MGEPIGWRIVGGPFSGRGAEALVRLLEVLGRPEGDFLARLDLDLLAGGGVAAHARGALAHLQDAETDDADAVALLDVLDDQVDRVAQETLGGLLRQFVILGELRSQMAQRDGGRGLLRRRSGGLLSHWILL